MNLDANEIIVNQLFFPYGPENFAKETVLRIYVDGRFFRIVLVGPDVDFLARIKSILDKGVPVKSIQIDAIKITEISAKQ